MPFNGQNMTDPSWCSQARKGSDDLIPSDDFTLQDDSTLPDNSTPFFGRQSQSDREEKQLSLCVSPSFVPSPSSLSSVSQLGSNIRLTTAYSFFVDYEYPKNHILNCQCCQCLFVRFIRLVTASNHPLVWNLPFSSLFTIQNHENNKITFKQEMLSDIPSPSHCTPFNAMDQTQTGSLKKDSYVRESVLMTTSVFPNPFCLLLSTASSTPCQCIQSQKAACPYSKMALTMYKTFSSEIDTYLNENKQTQQPKQYTSQLYQTSSQIKKCFQLDLTSDFSSDSTAAPKSDTLSASSPIEILPSLLKCDACPYCEDQCASLSCQICILKLKRFEQMKSIQNLKSSWLHKFWYTYILRPSPYQKTYTMCQVQRHCYRHDCWIVAHDNVYDVTDFLPYHPVGSDCIVAKAGKDCTVDFNFHTMQTQKHIWKQFFIGKLIPCPKTNKQNRK